RGLGDAPPPPSRAWAFAMGAVVVAGLLAFLYFGGVATLLRWILRRSGHTGQLPDPSGRSLLRLLPGYIFIWLVNGAAFVCLSRGIGLDIGFGVGTTAFAAACFMGNVFVFAPAGIGIRESSLAGLLTPILGSFEASVVLATLQRVWITAVELAGAASGAFVLRGTSAPGGTGQARVKSGDPAAGAPAEPAPETH
ncbi:MAG: hypothetical protein F4022_08110, partial [Gemmatimonadetes bacterium]|nr:hypothetical protein [Gemmatimonadota bacterium]